MPAEFKVSARVGANNLRFEKDTTINHFSSRLTQPKSQGISQAMLYATGMKKEDMDKAQIGIASCWYQGNPCNMHLLELSGEVKKAVDAYESDDMIGMQFNTVGVSDAISMGTNGMSYSLPSREIIADSIETVMGAQWYDALITIPGCDKNMPACVMAMCRMNRPSLMIYGGSIATGCSSKGETLDIISAPEAYGKYLKEMIDEAELEDIVSKACPGPGACGGMYTANTMASAIETLGLSLPYSSSAPAVSKDKKNECVDSAGAIRNLLEHRLRPSDILTKDSFLNAISIVIALGGSTNAVLHLIAMADSVDIELTLQDFQNVTDKTPLIADLKPSGKYRMEALHKIGGLPCVQKYMLEKGFLHGDCLTVTGKTLAENLSEVVVPDFVKQDVVMPLDKPIQPFGHIHVLYGNIAPEGSVAKLTGKEGTSFTGRANVYHSDEEMIRGLENGEIQKGDVIVIRYVGPKVLSYFKFKNKNRTRKLMNENVFRSSRLNVFRFIYAYLKFQLNILILPNHKK